MALLAGLFSFGSHAQSSDDLNPAAVLKQIAPAQWTVTWEDYKAADILWTTNDNLEGHRAYITDSQNQRTYLKAGIGEGFEVMFPGTGNYFTVDLSRLNLPDGKYELTIPEDYVNLVPGNGLPWEMNIAQYFDLIIGGGEQFTYTPQFSPIYGNYFTITWENVTRLAPGNTTGATLENKATGMSTDLQFLKDYMYSKANIRIDDNNKAILNINLENNDLRLDEGDYILHIPAGYVLFNGTKEGNEPIAYEFHYAPRWTEGRVLFDGPFEDGSVTVTYADASEIAYNTDYESDDVWGGTEGIFLFDSASQLFNFSYPEDISIEGNVMTIYLNGKGIKSGECQLTIDPDVLLVTIDGKTGPNVSLDAVFRFNYTNPDQQDQPGGDDNYDLYSGDAVWSVSEGTTVPYGTVVEVGWPGTTISPVEVPFDDVNLYSPVQGYKTLTFGEDVTISEDGMKLVIDLGSLPSATYRLNVPEGYVYVMSAGVTYLNTATSMDNLIVDNSNPDPDVPDQPDDTGVDGIASEGGRFTVYNAGGVKVLDTEDASLLESLPRGLYIINGKKLVK